MAERHTTLVTSRLARSRALLEAARIGAHGRQVMSPGQAAARLAGGFLRPIEREALQDVLHEVLTDHSVDLGELKKIRDLPGMVRAATRTLQSVWSGGIDLARLASERGQQRLVDLAELEAAVLQRLPASMLRPSDLVNLATERLDQAPAILGPISLEGAPDLDPVWRPFLTRLAESVSVTWHLATVDPPEWLKGSKIHLTQASHETPELARFSCANPRHEALEALRWARNLISTGTARPDQIALASPALGDWDQHIATISADANLPVSFVGGRPSLTTRDGQAAAALAKVLLKGLSQGRVRRLLSLVRGMTPATKDFPSTWHQIIIQRDAPLLDVERWQQLIDSTSSWPEEQDFGAALGALVKLLDQGPTCADEIGSAVLSGRALAIWRKALQEGPARALDVTLSAVRVEEDRDPDGSIVWSSAADLAACPRPYVRLLGLTSRGWPRTQGEDPLLPAHVVDPQVIDPVPVPERDRRDFETIRRATAGQLVFSRSRRDAEGRQTGESPLLRGLKIDKETYLRRERVPEHAVSEADRLLARSAEFIGEPRAKSAKACWRNWHIPELTPHDGLIRSHHPVLEQVLKRSFSATALRKLLRDPLGYVWTYAFGWDAPTDEDVPLSLDPLQFGSLAHKAMEHALVDLEGSGGFAAADARKITAAAEKAVKLAAVEFGASNAIPPRLMWTQTLERVRKMTEAALAWEEPPLPDQASFAEVPFGRSKADAARAHPLPWDANQKVPIPGTDLAIMGFIDRLDMSGDGKRARVTDYKTGQIPKGEIVLNGGAELQRCLYAFAVRALIDGGAEVEARLLYPRDGGRLMEMENPGAVLAEVTEYLVAARDNLREGNALIGKESGARDDDALTFALPGNAKEVYFETKMAAAMASLAPLPELWEKP